MQAVEPVTLEGRTVRLEPLEARHLPDLLEAAQDDEIWLYMPIERPRTIEDMQKWYQIAREGQEAGIFLPFAIIAPETNRAIGTTRYMAIARADAGLEIGWTWLGKAYWRTPVNTECKYLLLRHAFETLGCIRVWLKTDSRNLNSQRAIERIGAKKEGVIRKQAIIKNGYQRDSVFFSIIDDEWPEVKVALEEKLGLKVTQL